MIKSGKRSAQLITKARILLKADTSDAGEGWTDGEIAAALDTSVNTVGSARRQWVEQGFEATLVRKYNPNSARPRIFDGAAEAKLIALACSPAPEGFARWSLASPRRESRRIEHRRQGQRQYDRADAEKNIVKPHRNQQWVIPPEANAGFVAAMEDVLETYQKPRDPDRPLVCLDETSKQLIVETRAPIPAKPGQPALTPPKQAIHTIALITKGGSRASVHPDTWTECTTREPSPLRQLKNEKRRKKLIAGHQTA